MPAVSRAQQRLMGAALGGSRTPQAQAVRRSMTDEELRAYASGSMQQKPERVGKASMLTSQLRQSATGRHRTGRHDGPTA